jgi:hypothetical protein
LSFARTVRSVKLECAQPIDEAVVSGWGGSPMTALARSIETSACLFTPLAGAVLMLSIGPGINALAVHDARRPLGLAGFLFPALLPAPGDLPWKSTKSFRVT